MVTSAAKYDLADNFFVQEILQLGLPKENADAIATLYRRSKDELRKHFSDSMHLHHHRLASADWRVDRILASGGYNSQHGSKEETGGGGGGGGGGGDTQPQPQLLPPYLIHLNLNIDASPSSSLASSSSGSRKCIAFKLDNTKLDLMISELSKAHKLMESIGV